MEQVQVLEELKAELKATVEARKKRRFKGFKATLVVSNESFTYEVPVRYARIDSRIVDEKMAIRAKSRRTGKTVQQRYVTRALLIERDEVIQEGRCLELHLIDGRAVKVEARSRKVWVDEDGNEVPPEDVMYVQIIDGEEVEVEKFERTKEIVVEEFLPAWQLDSFLSEGEYEVWAEEPRNIAKLLKIANYMVEANVIGLCRHFSFGGFKAYAAVIYPVFDEERKHFVFVMRLTRMRVRYNHMMPVDVKEEEESRKKAKPRPVLFI